MSRPVTNMGLPGAIKCNVCKNTKSTAACFSNKQRDELVAHMRRRPAFNASRDTFAVCTSCTSQQVQELKCYWCDKTKGLNKFPLAQRRKPDTAECWRCQQERLNREPGTSSDESRKGSDNDDDNDDSDDSHTMSSAPGGASLHSDMGGLSLGGGAGAATFASHTSTNRSVGGGVSLGTASQSAGTFGSAATSNQGWTTASKGPPSKSASPASTTGAPSVASSSRTNIPPSRGFNRNAYGNPGRRAPPSEAGSSRTTDKWGKVKAGPRKTIYDKARTGSDDEHKDTEDDDEMGPLQKSDDEE